MVMPTTVAPEPGIGILFEPRLEWSGSIVTVSMAPTLEAPGSTETGVRAMYARLASAYRARPTVPDHGGGISGDKYPL